MPSSCPICFEATLTLQSTPCGHVFCETCLDSWQRQGKETCPLCRTTLQPGRGAAACRALATTLQASAPLNRNREEQEREHEERAARQQRIRMGRPGSAAAAASLNLSGPSTTLRGQAEREHEERARARERVLARERRYDAYKSNIFTPSGRPYESLPLTTLEDMRKQLRQQTVVNAIVSAGIEPRDTLRTERM